MRYFYTVTNRSRARWSLAVAVMAHALVLGWTVERARTAPTAETRDAQKKLTELEIAVEEPPAAATPVPPSPTPTESPRVEPLPARAATRTASQSPAESASAAATTESNPTPVVSAEQGGDGLWTYSPVRPPSPSSASAAASAEATAKLDKATTAGVGAVLAEWEKKAEDRQRKPLIFTPRDMNLGLLPGGQYVAVTRDRVRNSLVPLESHALLEFWTDSRGLVARVRVLSASSDPRAWDDVADALVEDAHTSFPLKIPSNADGLIVTLDVTSAMKTLSGAAATRNPLVKALSTIQNPMDAIADAKAVPQRVVSARVVSVEAF